MRKILLLNSVLLITLFSNCGGGPDLRNTVLAAEAMERAKAANAPLYAPREYKIAEDLFNTMNKELEQKLYKDANNTALLVIDAANLAIRNARLLKSTEK
ncbi:MAG: DUF4398 domain-containing protein [Spirochaetota bacterium]|nr:DUF4398 domain-containing protein [Spirochaetota bacterium]